MYRPKIQKMKGDGETIVIFSFSFRLSSARQSEKGLCDGFWKEQEEQNFVTPVQEGLSAIGKRMAQKSAGLKF